MKMLNLSRTLFAGAVFMAVSTLHATVIVEHIGSTDPTEAGWTAIGDAAMSGPNVPNSAWYIDDNSTSTARYYLFSVPSQTATDINESGWSLAVTLQVTDVNNDDSFTRYVDFVDGVTKARWGMDFTSDASGNTIVSLRGSGLTLNIGDSDAHTYSLVYDADAENAALYIDGSSTPSLISYSGAADSNISVNQVRWGSTSNVLVGSADYQQVTFSSIPEPAEGALSLGIATLVGCLFLMRTRLRKNQ